MSDFGLSVLYEDNHLLALAKPPGLVVQGASDASESLLARAVDYVRAKYHKPGGIYLGVVSRLDRPVTGVVLLARTSKAAARLAEQFREGTTHKLYWALVDGRPSPPGGECVDWLFHDDAAARVRVVPAHSGGARLSKLKYRTLRALPRGTLLEIELLSGRKHQIRVQLAHRGWAVLGDRKYGCGHGFPEGIALHARALSFRHPVRDELVEIICPVPAAWRAFGVESETFSRDQT